MAVSMKTSTGTDFMLGNAAQTTRKSDRDKNPSVGDPFKSLLDGSRNVSSVKNAQNNGSGVKQHTQTDAGVAESTEKAADNVRAVVNELREDERYEKALAALDREIARVSDSDEVSDVIVSEDVKELAEKIVKGEIDFDDVPDDVSAEELMKEIVALMIARLNPDSEDEEKEETFDPAVAAVNEQKLNREASSGLLLELYKLIEKNNERQAAEKADILDGISEPVDPDETLASAATADEKVRENAEEGVFEQIIDSMVDGGNAATEGTPVIQAQENVPTVSEMQNAASQSETDGEQQIVRGVEQGGQSNEAQMRFGAETQRAGEAVPTKNDEEKEFDNVIESFTVKETRTEKEPVEQTVNVTSVQTSRVRNASEELEMLKSAKLGKTDSGTETFGETAAVISSEQTVVFVRADGTELEIDPTAIVDQAQRLIERAIAQAADNQSEYSLVLNPEELGRITVKLIKAADGAISVTVAAENAQTQRVLEQHSELMQSNLRSGGINLESWQTVSESRQETYSQDYNGSSKNPYFRRDDAQNAEDDSDDRTFADIIAAM